MRILASLCLGATLVGAAYSRAQTAPMAHDHKPSAPSTTLTVSVGGKTLTLKPEDLAALPQRKVLAHNGHSSVDETYTGVAVSDLLAKLGVTMEGQGARTIYHSYLRATGTDGYFVLYSASELEGTMHTGEVIVALTVDGKPLDQDGRFKLVSTEDKRPARWVRNLTTLALVTVQ